MNEFHRGVILSLLRKALTGVSAVLVTNGWLSEDQTTQLIVGLSGAVASIILSVWDQYGSQLTKLAALTPGITTLDEAKALAKSPSAPPASTPSNVTPASPHIADVRAAQRVPHLGG